MSTRFRTVLVLTVAFLLGAAGFAPAGAQGSRSAPLLPAPPVAAAQLSAAVEEPPARIAAGFAVEPLADLVVAEEGAADAVRAIAEWNRADRVPMRNGIVRAVPSARAVRFDASITNAPAGLHAGGAFARVGSGSTVWGASVRVANAHRLRLHLADFDLPAGTRMWVYDDDGETVAFAPELAFEGELWTPSVGGETIRLEVELPAGAFESAAAADRGFTIDRVGQIFRLDMTGAPILDPFVVTKGAGDCLIDVSCVSPAVFPVADEASRAIATYEFPFGPFFAVCSGGVLNLAQEAPNDLDPPFLTANHCVSTPTEAAGVEAFWDFRTSVCGGGEPNLASLPRTNGSQLLVTSADSDFTLLGMALPAGRTLLGWNAEVPVQPANTILHRISHPVPFDEVLSQQYTRYRVKGQAEILTCATGPGDPAVNDLEIFHHTVFLEGGTYGGSSGAPLMLGNGQVVGQLFGACGPNVEDGCSVLNDELDGNFYTSFDLAAPFLGVGDPGDGWLSTPELPGFEFQVNITPVGGPTVQGQAEANCIVETFCASGALAGRPEVFVKVIGPRPNGFLWVQISRFTPSEVEVMVRQTSSGLVQEYTLPPVGALSDDVSGFQDREAFVPRAGTVSGHDGGFEAVARVCERTLDHLGHRAQPERLGAHAKDRQAVDPAPDLRLGQPADHDHRQVRVLLQEGPGDLGSALLVGQEEVGQQHVGVEVGGELDRLPRPRRRDHLVAVLGEEVLEGPDAVLFVLDQQDPGPGRQESGPRGRQLDAEGRAFASLALHVDRPAVIGDDRVGEREAEAGTALVAPRGEERVEDAVAHLRGHSDAVVFDGEGDAVALGERPHHHVRRLLVVARFEPVADQVDERLLHLRAAQVHPRERLGQVDADLGGSAAQHLLSHQHGRSNELVDILVLAFRPSLAHEVEDLAHDLPAPLGLLDDDRKILVEPSVRAAGA